MNVTEVPLASIVIHPRQRKQMSLEHIEKLARSIENVGLLHPVTLDRSDNSLIAGFTRYQAFMKLERETIPAVYKDELDEYQRQVIELEENIQRLDLEWWEKTAAIAKIHELQQTLHPDWSQRKTAEMIGESLGAVNQAIQVAKEMERNPTIRENKTAISALNKVKFEKQIEKRKEQVELKSAGKLPSIPAEIVVGDALELIRRESDESYDAVITNFPFGVELTLGKDAKQPYYDEEDYIVKLVRGVTHEAYRVLRPNSWMVGWFDMRKITYSNKQRHFAERAMATIRMLVSRSEHPERYAEAVQELGELAAESMGLAYWMQEAGFDHVTLLPSIWVKPNKTQGMIGDPRKGLIVAYEAFLFAGKGDPFFLKRGLQNIFIYDTPEASDRVHPLQMSFDLCTQIVSMVCMGKSRVLDPFAGSGSVGIGALNNQCSFKGFELDPKKAENGNMLLREHILAAVPQAKEA